VKLLNIGSVPLYTASGASWPSGTMIDSTDLTFEESDALVAAGLVVEVAGNAEPGSGDDADVKTKPKRGAK
jgi:hypothetical protein